MLHLKQLKGTFSFILWTKPARFHLTLGVTCSHPPPPPCWEETTSPGGERAAASETDLQLAAEATRIQPEHTPAPSDFAEKSDPVAGIKNNY